MKKSFFKDLGISDELTDLIMAEIKAEIKVYTDAENNYKNEIGNLRSDYEALKQKYDDDTSALNGKIEKMNFDFLLNSELEKSGVKNVKALTGFLDFEKLSLKDGRVAGLEEQIKEIKDENPYLFGSEQSFTGMAQGYSFPSEDGFMKNVRSAAGV
ncbi:MAG: phage scaffolding protein [Clostridia bacterium]|nr:phage scaffolding protein [Clostridia bacterium]